MKTTLSKTAFILALLFGACSAAVATPVLWTISGVTFDDGGTASGSFIYDADTNTYSSVNITTTAGTSLAGATYNFAYAAPATASLLPGIILAHPPADLTGTPALNWSFSTPLSNVGGNILFAPGASEGTCSAPNCFGPPITQRLITAGSISGTPVAARQIPTLGFGGLFILAIMLGAITRKRLSS